MKRWDEELKDDPDYQEYCMKCEKEGKEPVFEEFNRWLTSTTNAVSAHHYDPEEELKKRIAENKDLLNVVCR